MEDYLFFIHHCFGVKIHGFVLMSNHIHLLISAPNGNLSAALLYFLREVSKEITRLSGRINQTWGARNYKSEITSYHHFMNVYKYVYSNPLRARLCSQAEVYPYSTLTGLCGNSRINIPMDLDTILFNPSFDEAILKWINTDPDPEKIREMRLGLSRPVFGLKTLKKTERPSELESRLL